MFGSEMKMKIGEKWEQGRKDVSWKWKETMRVNKEKKQLERNETTEEIKTECWI